MVPFENSASEKYIVLVDEKFTLGTPVSECMSTLEHACAESDSFFGAVEKFSDFTLRAVPDLVFVPVETLPDRLEDLERFSSGALDGSNVRVFGLNGNSKREDRNVVHSLNQLEELIGVSKGRMAA